jgi:translation initiation factor 2B subunit (eIF-2B alpha/beta/delta family)
MIFLMMEFYACQYILITETKFFITEGVDYDNTMQGNEFEFGKIAFIILTHGSSSEVREIIG